MTHRRTPVRAVAVAAKLGRAVLCIGVFCASILGPAAVSAAAAAYSAVYPAQAARYSSTARLTLVSVPRPEVVTGGDVLLAAPAAALKFFLADGTELTEHRFANPAGGSWYLVEGLPESAATVVARDGLREYDSIKLHNTSSDGPVISGPREVPFFCQTQDFEIGPGLGTLPAAHLPACATRTRVDTLVRRADGGFEPVAQDTRPGAAFVRLETGVIDRAIYQIAMPADAAGQNIALGALPRAWNGKLIYKFGGGCRGGWYRQGAATAGVLDADLLGAGYAVVSASLNVFGNNCNDLLASEVMMMVREHFIETYGPPQFTLGFGCSGGSYQSLQIADNYPGLLDGILIGCTFPEVTMATLTNLFDARLLETYFAAAATAAATAATAAAAASAAASATAGDRTASAGARSGAGPAIAPTAAPPPPLEWSDAQIRAVTGYASVASLQPSADGAARIDVTPRTERKSAEFDRIVPETARYLAAGQRDGARPTLFDHTVNVYGRDAATGFALWALDNRGVQYGLDALNKGEISLAQFIDLNRRIGGMDREGNVVAARTAHDPAATRLAYSSGRILSARGGLKAIPIVDYRAWADLQAKGDIHMAYHSRSLRARLQRANNSLDNAVLLTEDGSCDGCELFSLKSAVLQLALQGIDGWLTALQSPALDGETPLARLRRARPASLSDACWVNGRKLDAASDDAGPCAARFPLYGFPRLVAGASIANDIVACQRRPLRQADYPAASPADFAALSDVFADGVCDWSLPGEGQVDYGGVWQSFGPVSVAGSIVAPAGAPAPMGPPATVPTPLEPSTVAPVPIPPTAAPAAIAPPAVQATTEPPAVQAATEPPAAVGRAP